MLPRFHDWQERLDAFLLAHAADRFSYGRWDCCLFVCDAIREMTGVDPAKSFRGRYATRKTAMLLVEHRHSRPSVRAVTEDVTAEFGMERCLTLFARRGDVALLKRPHDYALGLVDLSGEFIAVLTPRDGIKRLPLTEAHSIWHV